MTRVLWIALVVVLVQSVYGTGASGSASIASAGAPVVQRSVVVP